MNRPNFGLCNVLRWHGSAQGCTATAQLCSGLKAEMEIGMVDRTHVSCGMWMEAASKSGHLFIMNTLSGLKTSVFIDGNRMSAASKADSSVETCGRGTHSVSFLS